MTRDEIELNSLGKGSLALGDRWNLLILREAFRGARRFQDWTAALGVSDPVLSIRLRDLTDLELLKKVPYSTTPLRHEYRLTALSRDMWQVFVAIWLWDSRWTMHGDGDAVPPRARLRHHLCGYTVVPLLGCSACEARGVTPFETLVTRHPGYTYAEGNPPRRYRRVQQPSDTSGSELHAIDMLGDRWGTSVLAAAFLGARRFNDFTRDINGIPPLMLTQRLTTYVEQRVLNRYPVVEGGRRLEYHLTPKGLDFFGVFSNEIAWSSQAFVDRDGPPLVISHRPCGNTFLPVYVCNACNRKLNRREVEFEYAN
jgi:DNA-binding HxlR family transcriptional regulator